MSIGPDPFSVNPAWYINPSATAVASASATVRNGPKLTAAATGVGRATMFIGMPWWVVPRAGAVSAARVNLGTPLLSLDPLAVFTAPPALDPPDLVSDLPPFEQSSYEVRAVLGVIANELARLDSARLALIQNFFPLTADALLPLFEALLGLPVNPPASLALRHQLVAAYMQRLKSEGRGLDWTASISAAVGTINWNYQEYIGGQVANLIRDPNFDYDAQNAVPFGWDASNTFNNPGAGVQARTDFAWNGTKSMRINGNGFLANEGAEALLTGAFLVGQAYTFSVYLRGNAGGETVTLLFGTSADHATNNLPGMTSGGWTRYAVTWIPTATRSGATVCIQLSPAVAAMVYADGAMAALGSAGPYADGDTPGYAWFGPPGLSMSGTLISGPPAYTVNVNVPQAAAGFAWPFIRDITPAHLVINGGYTGGFIVGSTVIGSNL